MKSSRRQFLHQGSLPGWVSGTGTYSYLRNGSPFPAHYLISELILRHLRTGRPAFNRQKGKIRESLD